MALAAIVISQSGKPQTAPGKSRGDLSANSMVVLTNHDNTDVGSWEWTLRSPKGSKAILQGARNPVASFKPDVPGSYVVGVVLGTSDGQLTDTRIAAVGTATLGLRKPAAGEKAEFDPILGPWSAIDEAFGLIDDALSRTLGTDGSNPPTADIDWRGRKITGLGGLEVDGALRLGRIDDPEPVEGKAFLYLKDVRGSLDLFYCSPDGSTVRITRDGHLNIPVSFDDRIKLCPDDIQPGYLGSKVVAGMGLRTREINGALWVEPVCGSDPGTLCAGDDPRLSKDAIATPALVGVAEPAPNAFPLSDASGTLDSWVSKASDRKPGRMALGGDLSGSADAPMVVGLRGRPIPQAEGLLRCGTDGLEVVPYGESDRSVCRGDDPRLSDSRSPRGEAGGQVVGHFEELRVVGLTESGGTGLSFGPVPDGCALARRGDRIVGIGVSEHRAIPMVLNESTGSETGETVGCFVLDGSQDASPMVFQGICRVTSPGLVGIVSLHNATNDKLVAEVRFGETAFAVKKTNPFKPLPGKRLYEARIRLVGEQQQTGDRLVCMWAGLLA